MRSTSTARSASALRLAVTAAALALGVGACSDGDAPRCDAEYATPATFDPALAVALDALVASELSASGAPGATLSVHIPGQGTYAGAAGLRDVSAGLPMLPRTRLRVGSITKTFAAAALVRLAEQGEVALDDSAAVLVGELGLDSAITFAQLLSHQAGLFNYTDDPSFLRVSLEPWEPEEIILWSLEHGAVGQPGELYSYSNTGYYIVGLALEQLRGQPFHRVVRDLVLDPLALDDTSEELHEGRDCAMSQGYVVTGAAATDDIDMSWAWAAGGMVSSGVDLCRWAEALYRGDFLTPTSRAALIAPSANSLETSGGYGYATQHTVRGGRPVVGHTGSTMGFRGELFVDLESGVCVAVLLNDFASTPAAVSQPAWDAVNAALGL